MASRHQLMPCQFAAYKRDVLLEKYMATKISPLETFSLKSILDHHTLDGELFTTRPFSPNFYQQTLAMR